MICLFSHSALCPCMLVGPEFYYRLPYKKFPAQFRLRIQTSAIYYPPSPIYYVHQSPIMWQPAISCSSLHDTNHLQPAPLPTPHSPSIPSHPPLFRSYTHTHKLSLSLSLIFFLYILSSLPFFHLFSPPHNQSYPHYIECQDRRSISTPRSFSGKSTRKIIFSYFQRACPLFPYSSPPKNSFFASSSFH